MTRDERSARIRDGMERARCAGIPLGRPPNRRHDHAIGVLIAARWGQRRIARHLGVDVSVVRRVRAAAAATSGPREASDA